MISIIIPCYNEQESLPYFIEEINKVMSMIDEKFELIFVNDGSKDKTFDMLKDLSKKDKRIKYISLSRNFGKESAMLAGLDLSKGDYVAIMDADLQDPPKYLIKMYELITKEGYDCVGLRRVSRKGEPIIRSFFAKCYYKLINKISDVEVVDGARDFRLMTRQMVNSILELNECNRYSKGLFSWVGYNVKYLEYNNIERIAGNTKWSFFKLFKYSIDSIVGFSSVPLLISVIFGMLMLLTTLVMFIVFLVNKNTLLGIISLILGVSSLNYIFIGIMGIYLSKIQKETQNRPKYIIKETNIKQ